MKFIAKGPKGDVEGPDRPTARQASASALGAYTKKYGRPPKGTLKLHLMQPFPGAEPAPARKQGKSQRVRSNPSPAPADGLVLTAAEQRLIRDLRGAATPAKAIEMLAGRWKVPINVLDDPFQFDPAMMREGTSFVLGADTKGQPVYLEVMPTRSSARATASGKAHRSQAPIRRLPKRVRYRLVCRVDSYPAVFEEQ